MRRERDRISRVEAAVPWLASVILTVGFAPSVLRSSLMQGDLPGHLESIRRSADYFWPLPWGWDPTYLGGTMIGTVYPPLLTWLGGGIAKLVGAGWALRILLLASVVALPPCLARAARGFGLRRSGAAWASLAGLAVLWLPGRGLGGSLHQTLISGNAANGLVLPVFLLVLGRLRLTLARPGHVAGTAALLALVLLGHFLVGAVAGLTLVSYTLFAYRRRGTVALARGTAVAVLALACAAPFLVPFVTHRDELSPDAVAFNPPVLPYEWLALVVLAVMIGSGRPQVRRAILPAAALLAVLYVLRGFVFPWIGAPDVRMEYHRFRLYLYLLLVPTVILWIRVRVRKRTRRRILAWTSTLAFAALVVFASYDARGPRPVPMPTRLTDFGSERVLVLASPPSQAGSWHGLQTELPALRGFLGTKGLFVEGARWSRSVFEVERALAHPDARPRWWAIRIAPDEEIRSWSDDEVRQRLRDLGIGWVLVREAVSDRLRAVAVAPPVDLGQGYRLVRLDEAPLARRASADGSGIRAELSEDGTRIGLHLDPGGERAVVAVNPSSDWHVDSGVATLGRTVDGRLEVDGAGEVALHVAPRAEEWVGLAIGLVGFVIVAVLGVRGTRRGLTWFT